MTTHSLAGPFGWRSAWRHRGRRLLAGGAIASGVALGFSVHLINQAAVAEFTSGLRALSGTADLVVRGTREGIPLDTFTALAARSDVAMASPAIETEGLLAGMPRSFTLLGIDALRAGVIAPALVADTQESLDVLRDDAIFPSAVLAAEWGAKVGDSVEIQVAGRNRQWRIAGLLGAQGTAQGSNGPVVVADIAAVQEAVGRFARISRVDLRLRPGLSVEAAAADLRRTLPSSMTVQAPADAEEANERLSRAYRINLTVLALVALFTGSLLVFSCEALVAVKRRAELALLRVLGFTRQQILLRVLTQSLVLGALGAAVGLAAGMAGAQLVLQTLGTDLGGGYFRGVRAVIRPELGPAVAFFLCGLLAAVAGAWVPAYDVAHAPPAQALKPAVGPFSARHYRRWWPALVLVGAGGLLTQVPPIDEIPWAGYLAIACMLLAAIAALPALCSVIARLIPSPARGSAWLAIARIRRAPMEAAVSLAAMVAAVSLTVSMAVMVGSFRSSVIEWLGQLLPADAYLRTAGARDHGLGVADQQRIAAVPGVRKVEFLRIDHLTLDPARPPVTLLARDVEVDSIGERLPMVTVRDVPPGSIPVWLSEVASGLYRVRAGDTMRLPLGPTGTPVFVAGIWRDYGRVQGAIVIERNHYANLTGDLNVNDAALWYEAGATPDLTAAFGWLAGRIETATPGEIKGASLRVFDRTFAVTYGLEVAAILIGLAGLSAGIGASVAARRGEFGVLRHLGMTRRQIAWVLAAEGSALSTVGFIVGAGTGWILSFILIEVVNRQSFHWSMQMQVPIVPIAGFGCTLIAVAALVAIASGRQAMQGEAARAVHDDW